MRNQEEDQFLQVSTKNTDFWQYGLCMETINDNEEQQNLTFCKRDLASVYTSSLKID